MPVLVDYGPLATKTLRAWLNRTGFSYEAVAAWLGEHGVGEPGEGVSYQLIQQWAKGSVNLPFPVVPLLMAMAPNRAAMWTEALLTAAARLTGDEVTEDLVPLVKRAMRQMRESSESNAALLGALEDGRIDDDERRRCAEELRQSLDEGERLHAALTAPRIERVGRRP